MTDGAVDAGHQVARFTLRTRLGEGGMGQVWRARDPELERDVAVKLLRPEVVASASQVGEARARLRREAQAMARLAHPNVVPIYEVGEADAQVFLVMELVEGGTLRAWLDVRPRAPAAIIDAFVAAGRGLAAAHEAGLVHRDFKPDNVLVGADGRIRVTDFGLVGLDASAAAPPADDAAGLDDARAALRTRTGAIIGTPAYAAPEVWRREPATAKSDQFAFCVALYEALWRAPPFAGDTVVDLYEAVTGGALRVPAGGVVAPAVKDAIVRGLATDPAARWPSMAALLLALMPPPRRRWWRWGAALTAAALGVGALTLAARRAPLRWPTVAPPPAPPPALAPPVQLTATGGCAESPIVRGDQVVYEQQLGDGRSYLTRVALAGGAPTRISERPLGAPVAGSAPDRVVAVLREGGADRLVEVDLAGNLTELPSPPAHAAPAGVAWDGRALYYARPDRSQIRQIAAGVERAVADLPRGWLATSLELSADQRWLLIGTGGVAGACVVDRRAPVAAPRCEPLPGSTGTLMIVADDGYLVTGHDGTWWRSLDGARPPRRLTPTMIDGMGLAVTGDGRAVVASQCVRHARLMAVPTAGGAARALATGRFLTPTARATDGALALARYVTTEDTTIAVRTPDGRLRDLTPPDHVARSPAWDAAGTHVAYRRFGDAGGIYAVDLAPSAPRRVTTVSTDDAPLYLADGRLAFVRFTAAGAQQLFVVDPATGVVAPAPRPDRWPYARHPDGRLVVGDPERHRLWLWDPASDREVAIAASDDPAADYVAVARDGRALWATWREELWRVAIDPRAGRPGRSTLIYRAPAGTTLERASELPDGTVVVAERFFRGELFVSRLPPR